MVAGPTDDVATACSCKNLPAGRCCVCKDIYIYKFAIRSFCCNGTSFTRCDIQIDVALSHRKSEKEPAQNQIILRNTREFSSGIQWKGIQQSWGGPLKWLHHASQGKLSNLKFAIRSFCCNGTSFTRCDIQIDVALSHRKSEKEPAQNQIIQRNTREFSSGIQLLSTWTSVSTAYSHN